MSNYCIHRCCGRKIQERRRTDTTQNDDIKKIKCGKSHRTYNGEPGAIIFESFKNDKWTLSILLLSCTILLRVCTNRGTYIFCDSGRKMYGSALRWQAKIESAFHQMAAGSRTLAWNVIKHKLPPYIRYFHNLNSKYFSSFVGHKNVARWH